MFKGFVILFIYSVLAGCQSNTAKSVLKIAVASNLQLAIDSIITVFETKFPIKCELSSNSSGALTNQIIKGAPFDLFISANLEYPDQLFKIGFAEKPSTFVKGQLCFVYPKNRSFQSITEAIKSASVKRIAIPDPETAPYGIAAKSYLTQKHDFNIIKQKIMYGENIEQTNHYLKVRAVDAIFTSYSFALKNQTNFNYIKVDSTSYSPIVHGLSILKKGRIKNSESCESFATFLNSKQSKDILIHFGFSF
jgi:molybdate transport system substrate-binding protein